MLKYLEIKVTSDPKEGEEAVSSIEMFNADEIFSCLSIDLEVRIYLKGANSYILLEYNNKIELDETTVAYDLVKAVNDALISAAETTWTRATSKVQMPYGTTVSSLEVVKVI